MTPACADWTTWSINAATQPPPKLSSCTGAISGTVSAMGLDEVIAFLAQNGLEGVLGAVDELCDFEKFETMAFRTTVGEDEEVAA